MIAARRPRSGFLLKNGVLDERWIVTHLNELRAEDFELLRRAPRFHVAHCPRSHAYFDHAPFALEKLRALGFNIALGTDSLASNPDLSLFAEMRHLQKQKPALSALEILAMATLNGAAALGQAGTLGPAACGLLRRIWSRCRSVAELATVVEQILAFDGSVPWLMVAGRWIRRANE